VLPSFKQPGPDSTVIFNKPLNKFSAHAWTAIVNVPIERDGLARRYSLGQKLGHEFLPSMGALLAGKYNDEGTSFLIDFGIRSNTIEMVSYIDVLNGNPETLARLKNKKLIIGGTALELGDRFSIPNGGIVSGPVLQALAAESILLGRELHWTSGTVSAIALGLLALMMTLLWRRFSAHKRIGLLIVTAALLEASAYLLQSYFPIAFDTALLHIAIVAYVIATVIDEIDLRALLSRIAENRFHRIAVSLGDGLVCTDKDFTITVWNPSAAAMFGYTADEMIGQPFSRICAISESLPFLVHDPDGQRASKVSEFDGIRRDGEIFPVEGNFAAWQGTDGIQHGAVLRDISLRKRAEEKVRFLAEHDPLTGLINRHTFESKLEHIVSGADITPLALLIVGIDSFQQINDLLGHSTGDAVLRAVAQRLQYAAIEKGIVARLNGDEFAIAAPGIENIHTFATDISDAFRLPIVSEGRSHTITVTIGASVFPTDGKTADELISNCHLALRRAKVTDRGECTLFEPAIRREMEDRLRLEVELVLAAERNEFELFYQPQIKLGSGEIIGAEALIRWRHPERGLVSPALFMPVVNTSSISAKVSQWVLETACRQGRIWEAQGHPLRVGVNLSPSQLHSGDLAATVADVLANTELTPSLLELEVTEDILLLDEKRVLATFQRIQDLGVRIVFDDFGTGYASLSYLKKFPLDGLKIDQSFVRELLTNRDDAAIVGSTLALSKQLGLSVIAEGIEDKATADFLALMGCQEGQGYLFGRPAPVAEFERRFSSLAKDLTPHSVHVA